MPQKYTIVGPNGQEYEIEKAEPQGAKPVSKPLGAQVVSGAGEALKTFGMGAAGMAHAGFEAVKAMQNPFDAVKYVRDTYDQVKQFSEKPAESLGALKEEMIGSPEMPIEKRIGRGVGQLGLLLGAHKIAGPRMKAKLPAAPVAEEAAVAQKLLPARSQSTMASEGRDFRQRRQSNIADSQAGLDVDVGRRTTPAAMESAGQLEQAQVGRARTAMAQAQAEEAAKAQAAAKSRAKAQGTQRVSPILDDEGLVSGVTEGGAKVDLVKPQGMTKGAKTVSLSEMVEKYGLEETAKRANMTVEEVAEATGKPLPTSGERMDPRAMQAELDRIKVQEQMNRSVPAGAETIEGVTPPPQPFRPGSLREPGRLTEPIIGGRRATDPKGFGGGEPPSAVELARQMSALRDTKPRPLAKLFGTNGPSPQQLEVYEEGVRKWNREMSALRRQHKVALERDNEAFYANQAAEKAALAPEASSAVGGPTKGLRQMVAEHGLEGAAERSRMTPAELSLELGDPEVKTGLRRLQGAYKDIKEDSRVGSEGKEKLASEVGKLSATAARALGLTKAGPSVAPGSEQTFKEMLSRMGKGGKGDTTMYGGFPLPNKAWLKANPGKTGAAIGGGLGLGYGANTEGEDPLGTAALGALGGGAIGKFGARQLYIDSLLGGGAVPKNLMAAIGGPITAQLENIGAASKLQSSPIKEMFRVPTNVRNFVEGLKNPQLQQANMSVQEKVRLPFGRTIGAIDNVLKEILKRSGLTPEEWERHLLTSRNTVNEALGTQGEIRNPASRWIFPFLRVPFNVVRGGFQETAQMFGADSKWLGLESWSEPVKPHVNPWMRRGLTAGSVAAGETVGEWVKDGATPEIRKRRAIIATIMAAGFGPRALPFTAGAGLGGAPSNTALGQLSPLPELAFHPEDAVKFPGTSAVNFWSRMFGKEPQK